MERLLQYFKPTNYFLEIRVFRNKDLLQGTVRVNGEIYGDIVKFHAVGMSIDSVHFRMVSWMDSPEEDNTLECKFDYDGQILSIPITDEMRVKADSQSDANREEGSNDWHEAEFTIKYTRRLNHNMQGCYMSTYMYNGEEQQIVATQFESHYAREAFPCIDEPAAKATFYLTLLVPDRTEADVILANTPLHFKGTDRYTFEPTPKMSPYLLAWVIGPLRSVSAANKYGVRVSSYAPFNQSTESLIFANETAIKALEYYNDQFGVAYPLSKLDQVALPDFEAGAMENWGLVTYRESMMLAEKNSTLETKKTIATTVTHELSHQWFGNLVTMKWWDDLWLNESFATMMEYFATDAIYPEFNIWESFFVHECYAALLRDSVPGVQAVHQDVEHPEEIATLFDPAIVYAKGAHLMLMLTRMMREENFYKGLTYYFERFQFDNTVGDDLWNSLQIFADFDVREFMHAWISQPGYPALQECHNGDKTWWEQQRFLINGATDDTKWPLPEVRNDMSGHYLLDLGEKDFGAQLTKFDQLSQEQKLRLLIDRMLLAKAGHVPSSSLLDLLPKFIPEKSSALWSILISIINNLKIFCPPESEAKKDYQKLLRQLTEADLHKLDLDTLPETNDEIKRRDLLLCVAYYAEDQDTLKKLAQMYRADLKSLDPELRGHILAAKMYFDEAEIFDDLLKQYQETSDSEIKDDILSTLATCIKDPKHIDRMIVLLKETKIVRPQDHLFLYVDLVRNYRSRNQALDWLIQNWSYVERLTGDKSIEEYPRYTASALQTPEEAQKFYNFFDQKKDLPILRRTMDMAHAEVDSRLSLIKHQSDQVAAKLKELI